MLVEPPPKIEPDLAAVAELLKTEPPAAEVEPPNGELAAVVVAVELLPPNIDPKSKINPLKIIFYTNFLNLAFVLIHGTTLPYFNNLYSYYMNILEASRGT